MCQSWRQNRRHRRQLLKLPIHFIVLRLGYGLENLQAQSTMSGVLRARSGNNYYMVMFWKYNLKDVKKKDKHCKCFAFFSGRTVSWTMHTFFFSFSPFFYNVRTILLIFWKLCNHVYGVAEYELTAATRVGHSGGQQQRTRDYRDLEGP